MKKTLIVIVSAVFLLSACGGGNKLDLDEEKAQGVTAEEFLKKKSVAEANYEKEDIEIVKICEAVEKRDEDFGVDGEYLVYSQTKDGEYKLDFTMTSEYEIGYGSQSLEEIEDRCITFD